MKTTADLLLWIEENVPQDKRKEQDPSAALLWFWAVRQANQMQDYSTKDWAHLLLGGLPPLTLTEIDQDLSDPDLYESAEDFCSDLVHEMREFWSVD